MTNEDYVTYETAQALKKAGFDWKCAMAYHHDMYSKHNLETMKYALTVQQLNEFTEIFAAPTLAQAQKWLRNVKDCVVLVKPQIEDIDYTLTGKWYHEVWIDDNIFEASDTKNIYFDTYESALTVGIEAALKLIEEGEAQ